MADPLCHATQGGLMLIAPFICWIRRRVWIWILGIAGGLCGMLPDLIGLYGFIVLRDHGQLYNSAHYGPIRASLKLIPMTWLHYFFDSYMHDPERTWNDIYLRNSLELLLWMVNIGVIALFVWIYRRNNQRRRHGTLPLTPPPFVREACPPQGIHQGRRGDGG